MMESFTYSAPAHRIVFGAEASVFIEDYVKELGSRRVLVLSTPGRAGAAQALRDRLGELAVGTFDGACMHTPVEVTERAISVVAETRPDCLVALGGSSTVGLSKAIAWRTDLPQIVLPTTYAGSEVTPVLGETEAGVKKTLRDPCVLPEIVIYDPDLTLDLPVEISVASALNAMAHAFEALYAKDRNPISSLMATEGLQAMHDALPAIIRAPHDHEARYRALYGAWLCGTVLGTVGMGLHHKVCHVLGGSFGMPHAETHSIMLPHTVGFNAEAVSELMKPAIEVFGNPLGRQLYEFCQSVEAPASLRQLGLPEGELARAAEMISQDRYWNPREANEAILQSLLLRAWQGQPPPLD